MNASSGSSGHHGRVSSAASSRFLAQLVLAKGPYGRRCPHARELERARAPAARSFQEVGLKAFSRIAQAWSLTLSEASKLADMSASTWKRAKQPGYRGELLRDQMLRLSAIVGLYKSIELYFSEPLARTCIKLSNQGPEFDGISPLQAMLEGCLPRILRVRTYVDALRGGV